MTRRAWETRCANCGQMRPATARELLILDAVPHASSLTALAARTGRDLSAVRDVLARFRVPLPPRARVPTPTFDRNTTMMRLLDEGVSPATIARAFRVAYSRVGQIDSHRRKP